MQVTEYILLQKEHGVQKFPRFQIGKQCMYCSYAGVWITNQITTFKILKLVARKLYLVFCELRRYR